MKKNSIVMSPITITGATMSSQVIRVPLVTRVGVRRGLLITFSASIHHQA
jgi:hypothetical protein